MSFVWVYNQYNPTCNGSMREDWAKQIQLLSVLIPLGSIKVEPQNLGPKSAMPYRSMPAAVVPVAVVPTRTV